MRYTGCTLTVSTSLLALQHPPRKKPGQWAHSHGRAGLVPNKPPTPFIFTGMQTASSHLHHSSERNAHSRMDIQGLKEMRWKKAGKTRANLDLKSWNKILRSGGRRSPVWKYLHSMVFVADKWTWLLYGSDFYEEGRQALFTLTP